MCDCECRDGEGTDFGSQVLGSVTDDGAKRVAHDAEELGERVIGIVNGFVYDRAVMTAALKEAERFMAYFAEEDLAFVGPGTPKECLAKIRAALAKP